MQASVGSPTVSLPQGEPDLEKKHSCDWLHIVSHIDPRYGGVSAVVPELCSAIRAESQCFIGLAAFCRPDEEYHPKGFTAPITFWPSSRSTWFKESGLSSRFRESAQRFDGFHIHGLWEQSTFVSAGMARKLKRPYVLSAHGMLDPWALQNKRWKKLLYSRFVEQANVRGAACLHALTRSEANDYRRFGSKAPIAIIPNAVNVLADLDPELFLKQFPVLQGKRLIVFLGRIHFKKGLDILIKAWKEVSQRWPEAHLVLAGPDSEDSRADFEELVMQSGLSAQVLFTGMLDGVLKWSCLSAAECFVLPSYSEGLSTAVLEAMACGVPVLVTHQCNMPEIETHGAGWVIQSEAAELAYVLDTMLKLSSVDRKAIGTRGRQLVQEKYSWSSVAQRMAQVYEWILGGSKPTLLEIEMG